MALVRWVRSLAASSHLGTLSQSAYCTSQRAGYKVLVTRGFPDYTNVRDELFEFSDHYHKSLFKTNPIFFQKHGFSRVVATRAHPERQVDKKSFQGSLGAIIEPYLKRRHLPFFKRWFTLEGWEQISESLDSQLKTALALLKLRQITGYNKRHIHEGISGLYIQFWKAHMKLDCNAIRPLLTERLLFECEEDMKRRKGLYAKVHWKTLGIQNLRILQARLVKRTAIQSSKQLVATDKTSADRGIVQVTLMILSINTFAGYDQNGKLVAGHPDKVFFQDDIWVCEINLGAVEKKWKLCDFIPP